MAWTYDPTTDLGKVRLLCTDVDSTNQLFTDAEIQAFLDISYGIVPKAAAHALDRIASTQALLLKKIRIGDLQTDGPALAKELRNHAEVLRHQLEEEVDFDWAEMNFNTPSALELIYKSRLRNG